MLTVVLIFSLLILSLTFFAVFRRRLFLYPKSENENLPPIPQATSLFAPTAEELRLFEQEENEKILAERREEIRRNLIRRANEEDFGILTEAKASQDGRLYEELLDLLIEKAKDEPEKLENLGTFISQNELASSAILAERLLAKWRKEPSMNSLSKVLHISALASSAETYLQAVQTAFNFWKRKKIENVSANELIAVLESHYWLLAREARISGAGFLLKEELASVRREITESSRN